MRFYVKIAFTFLIGPIRCISGPKIAFQFTSDMKRLGFGFTQIPCFELNPFCIKGVPSNGSPSESTAFAEISKKPGNTNKQ